MSIANNLAFSPHMTTTTTHGDTSTLVGFHAAHLHALHLRPLSSSACAVLGSVDDEDDYTAHSMSPKLIGRIAKLYFTDKPSIYYIISKGKRGCISSPAKPDRFRQRIETPILIDPRYLTKPLRQLPRIKLIDAVTIDGNDTSDAGEGNLRTSKPSSKRAGPSSGIISSDRTRNPPDGDDKKDDISNKGTPKPRTFQKDNIFSEAVPRLTKLPQMPIGAVELMTFFPNHKQWPTVILRCYWNDWNGKAMARAQLHARTWQFDAADVVRRDDTLRYQLRTVVKAKYGNHTTPQTLTDQPHTHFHSFAPVVAPPDHQNVNIYDVSRPLQQSGNMFQPPRNQQTLNAPATVTEVIAGVVNWPTGEDAGILTQALQHAQQTGQLQLTTDDLPGFTASLITQNMITETSDMLTADWDVNAFQRERQFSESVRRS